MHLFENNRNVDLFNSLQLIRLHSLNGEAVQSLLKHIAERKYGYVSRRFAKILSITDKGVELAQAIDDVQKHEPNKYLKFLMSSIRSSIDQAIDLNYVIEEIEEQIIDEQKNIFDKYILYTNRMSMAALYVTFAPFIYVILEIINWVVVDFMEGSSFMSDSIRIGFFVANTVALLLITMLINKNEA